MVTPRGGSDRSDVSMGSQPQNESNTWRGSGARQPQPNVKASVSTPESRTRSRTLDDDGPLSNQPAQPLLATVLLLSPSASGHEQRRLAVE